MCINNLYGDNGVGVGIGALIVMFTVQAAFKVLVMSNTVKRN